MSNILNIETVDRPDEVALVDALHKAINDIAVGKMTVSEILGCLDLVSKSIYQDYVVE